MSTLTDPLKITIRSYEEYNDIYNKGTRDLNNYPGLRYELDLFLNLLKGDKILDIGFGSGRDTLYFLNKHLKVYGIELTFKFIEELRKTTNSPLSCMDLRSLAIKNNTFNGLWTCASLVHIPKQDVETALREFNRVLSKSGILYLSVKEGQGEKWVQDRFFTLPRYFSYYSLDEISSLVSRQGFEIIHKQIKPNLNDSNNWISIFAYKSSEI